MGVFPFSILFSIRSVATDLAIGSIGAIRMDCTVSACGAI